MKADSRSTIYLDHNATSPIDMPHWRQLQDLLFEKPVANASSPHAAGRRASDLVSLARRSLAQALGVNPAEIVFLSSASEANNTALKGADWAKGHCIATAFEHPSVHALLKTIPHMSFVDRVAHKNGLETHLEWACSIVSEITPNTRFITVMAANNETGHVFPVKLLGDFLHKKRYPESSYWGTEAQQECMEPAFNSLNQALDGRISQETLRQIHLHVDATQAFGKIRANNWVSAGIDSVALSGHKVAALPGGAALVVRRGRSLRPLIEGGGQERFRRAGTENTPAIVSLGLRAAEMLHEEHWARVQAMRELAIHLEVELAKFSALQIVSDARAGLPNTVHVVSLMPDLKAEDMLIELDLRGIQASSGSACSSGTNRPSHVVQAMGFTESLSRNALRFSLGLNTTRAEILAVRHALGEIFARTDRAASTQDS